MRGWPSSYFTPLIPSSYRRRPQTTSGIMLSAGKFVITFLPSLVSSSFTQPIAPKFMYCYLANSSEKHLLDGSINCSKSINLRVIGSDGSQFLLVLTTWISCMANPIKHIFTWTVKNIGTSDKAAVVSPEFSFYVDVFLDRWEPHYWFSGRRYIYIKSTGLRIKRACIRKHIGCGLDICRRLVGPWLWTDCLTENEEIRQQR